MGNTKLHAQSKSDAGYRSTSTIYCGDVVGVLKTLPTESVNCCITSPPYYRQRDYGVDGQIGLEETPHEYVERLVGVFREVHRLLREDGTLWVNVGDSYAGAGSAGNTLFGNPKFNKNHPSRKPKATPVPSGCKPKDLIGIPWMLAFALRADGWYLRSEIIWHKPTPTPESVKDRPTKGHEQIFLLSKSKKDYYDSGAVRENSADGGLTGRNKRSVWTIASKPFKDAHFATFPPEFPETCLLAGSPQGGVVLDPFSGAATTGIVAVQHGRSYVGIELNPDYVEISKKLFQQELGLEIDARYFKAPEYVQSEQSIEVCHCAIAISATRCINVDSERGRHYEDFREQMLALAATELAA